MNLKELEAHLQSLLDAFYEVHRDVNIQIFFSSGKWGYIDDGRFQEVGTLPELDAYLGNHCEDCQKRTHAAVCHTEEPIFKGTTIEWTPEKLVTLKQIYAKCEDGDVFQFEGHDIFKSYAKYLIEHLDNLFKTVKV